MSAEAEELVIFIDNDGKLYEQMTKNVIKNLVRRKRNGTYNATMAVVAFQYLAEEGAKRYVKENGGGVWHKVFPVSVRKEAATQLRDQFEAEYKASGYKDIKT